MTPHAPPRAIGSGDPPISRSDHFVNHLSDLAAADPQALRHRLIEAIFLALIPLGKPANETEHAALIDSLDNRFGAEIGQCVADLVKTFRPRQPDDHPTAADWVRFVNRHPNKIDLARAEQLFLSLAGWSQIRQEFWEGHDRHLLWAKLCNKAPANPYWWIHDRRWTDRPVDGKGQAILGRAELARLSAEKANVRRQIEPVMKQFREPLQSGNETRAAYAILYNRAVQAIDRGALDEAQTALESLRAMGDDPQAYTAFRRLGTLLQQTQKESI